MEIRGESVQQAARALLLFTASTDTSSQPTSVLALFEGPKQAKRPIAVEISFLKAPTPNRVPQYFKLPHEILSTNNVCMITPAPQRKYKDELFDLGLESSVSKIIDVQKLAAKFSNPVARRALAKSFDAFFVHSDVSEFPTLLTGEFLTWQTPVWMDPSVKALGDKIAATRRIAVMPRRGYDNVSVVIGHSGQTIDELVANCESFCEQLAAAHDGGKNVLSMRLSSSNVKGQRVALPFYAHKFEPSSESDSAIGQKRARD